MTVFARLFLVVGLVAALSLTAGPARAEDKAEALKQGVNKLAEVMGGEEGLALMMAVEVLKKSGLSYQPSLAAPTAGVLGCKDKEQLRTIFGLYMYDGLYAAAFGKKKEVMAARNAMLNDLAPELGLVGEKRLLTLPPETLKKVADDPGDPEKRRTLLSNWTKQFDRVIEWARTDPEMMDLLVDLTYGAALEATYMACKLAVTASNGSNILDVFNVLSVRLHKLDQVLNGFAKDDKLSAVVELGERRRIMDQVTGILSKNKGKLTEANVKAILALVEPVRAPLVKPCQ